MTNKTLVELYDGLRRWLAGHKKRPGPPNPNAKTQKPPQDKPDTGFHYSVLILGMRDHNTFHWDSVGNTNEAIARTITDNI